MTPSRLPFLYRRKHYQVAEADGCWLVGFKPDTVSFIVKEIFNPAPLTRDQAEALYAPLVQTGAPYACRAFRLVAHGGYEPEVLDFEMHGLAVSDDAYLESLASDRHIELFPHNEAAYRAILRGFETRRIGAVVQATGTGKSFLLARYIADHADERILVVAPNVTILGEIRQAVNADWPTVRYHTFQALVLAREKGIRFEVDHILVDEFHHVGAEVWGEALREIIEANPAAKVLGTSATPIRPEGMLDTVEIYFEGNLFHELTLPQAWYYGILPVPRLVQSVYGLNSQLDKLQRILDRSSCTPAKRGRLQQKLDTARLDFKTSFGASALIRQFLPASVHKLLVFCRDQADLKQMVPQVMGWLEEAGREAIAFEVHNEKSDKENKKALEAFRQHTPRLHVLFSINMLIEGLHVEGVEAALFLRRTESYVVTLQQLGRCLKAGSKEQPVILDFVNNLSGKSVYDVMACDLERLSSIRSPRGFEGISDFQVTGFFSNIRERVDEILSELEPWQVMYERLLDYRMKEDDWPSASEGKLGLWCHTQRIARKRGTLLPGRICQLDSIGFCWDGHNSRWTANYELLKAFYSRHQRWPKKGENRLSTWCHTQRQARKNGKLAKERIRKLEAIGFLWEQDWDKEWRKNFEKLKKFYQTCDRWPKATEGPIGSWCSTQRKMYKQRLLSEERQEALEKIGFPWSAETIWTQHFRQLQLFYQHCQRWPASREGALGSWCCVQRRMYRQNRLSAERIRRLEEIGFPW